MLRVAQVPQQEIADLERGRALLRSGEFAECHALLDSLAESPDVVSLRARVLFRERRYEDALRQLLAAEAEALGDRRADRLMLLGAAYAHSGKFVEAQPYFDEASRLAPDDDELHFELAYHRGIASWSVRDDKAALHDAGLLETSHDHTYKALGFILRAWVEVHRGNTQLQAKLMISALNELEKAHKRDEYLIARTVFTLAAVCREIAAPRATRQLRKFTERVKWSENLTLDHFQLLRCLGWIEALNGNQLAAFRLFKESANLAPSKAWKILTLLDRAKLARSNGEESFALDQLHEAHALAGEVSWKETHDEERCALLILAELFALTDPRIATSYIQKVNALPPLHATLAYASDRRANAFAAFSAGIAHKQLGSGAIALAALTDAWETFEQYNYGWRSALAAAEIYELTGARTWLSRARHAITPWPNCWIARKIAKLDADKLPTARLTTTQRRVYDALLEGSSTKEIAERLGRSPNTIRNHIAAVFVAFRVKSRAQLLAATFSLSNLNAAQRCTAVPA